MPTVQNRIVIKMVMQYSSISMEKWNADVALGFTPDENTWVEITGGKSDGESLYAGRSMDGSQFARESLGLRLKRKISLM